MTLPFNGLAPITRLNTASQVTCLAHRLDGPYATPDKTGVDWPGDTLLAPTD